MIGSDISIYESGLGGEIALTVNDVDMTDSLYNQVYLAWFGGNIKESHVDAESGSGEENLSYWQNDLLLDDESNKMISGTEIALSNVSFTSQGLYELLNIAKHDLEFLKDLGEVEVKIEVVTTNLIKLVVDIKSNFDDKNYIYKFIWDSTVKELIKNI